MKNLGYVIGALLLLVSISTTAQKTDLIKKVTFEVNLTCHHCEKVMMKNLPYEKGVKDVKVDLEKKEVTLLFRNDKNSVALLQKAIEDLGYTAKEKAAADKANKAEMDRNRK
ncbi:MAG: heavy-metal-associated domain-containing protein [Salinivirgaceae bacterium]